MSNKIARRDLLIPQGTDWSESFSIENEDGTEIDLTGYSLVGHVRVSEAKGATLAFSFTFVISTTTVTVSVARATTTALTVGEKLDDRASQFWYDYELTSPGGVRSRIQEGRVTISREITQ